MDFVEIYRTSCSKGLTKGTSRNFFTYHFVFQTFAVREVSSIHRIDFQMWVYFNCSANLEFERKVCLRLYFVPVNALSPSDQNILTSTTPVTIDVSRSLTNKHNIFKTLRPFILKRFLFLSLIVPPSDHLLFLYKDIKPRRLCWTMLDKPRFIGLTEKENPKLSLPWLDLVKLGSANFTIR